jgi:uncharacterized protein YsxB (DUF464 family)
MIKATFTRGNEEIVLKVEGHAGQADKGHDIVCSAASILTYTIAQYLQFINEHGGLQKKPHIILNDGNALIVAKPNSEYEAEVIYVSATATESNGMDIGSLAGSIMGGGNTASGAEIKVKIKNPDEKVVIGFDVDVKIELATLENVLKVPVESVIYNNGTYSVYVFNEADGTVEKRTVVKGILDNASYQILEGLKAGDKVVRSPDPTMEDGTVIAEKKA